MGDRELLEWAAKANGMSMGYGRNQHFVDLREPCIGVFGIDDSGNHKKVWNPLSDDGDCARMEAKLMADIKWYPFSVVASASAYDCTEIYADHDRDRAKARRYASTRAAAEIGKATAPAGEGA